MSFMGKVLASFGIGAAKVDTILNSTELVPGDKAEGIVQIQGGNVEQKVDSIYFSLYTAYQLKIDDRWLPQRAELRRYRLTRPLYVRPGEFREVPFTFHLPFDTPVTVGKTKVWVKTGLEISLALDPTDQDYITVLPAAVPAAVMQALGELGFRLHNADCGHANGIFRSRLPFVQEFEFVPAEESPFAESIEEIEVVFRQQPVITEVFMQLNRRRTEGQSRLAELEQPTESLIRIKLTERDVPDITRLIESSLHRRVSNS